MANCDLVETSAIMDCFCQNPKCGKAIIEGRKFCRKCSGIHTPPPPPLWPTCEQNITNIARIVGKYEPPSPLFQVYGRWGFKSATIEVIVSPDCGYIAGNIVLVMKGKEDKPRRYEVETDDADLMQKIKDTIRRHFTGLGVIYKRKRPIQAA